MLTTTKTRFVGTVAAMVLGVSLASTPAFAGGGDRFECKADSQSEDASMDARFEEDHGRMKFDASFEAAAGGTSGTLTVFVNGANVGTITLVPDALGDLAGDLSLDSEPDENAPFPGNFPQNVGDGTAVTVGVLGCTLQG